MEKFKRVEITPEAKEIVQQLEQQHGKLIFHQSGGCCDGSSPMLLPEEDFYIDENDILLGEVAGIPFYMSHDQFEYWKHTHLTIALTNGRGSSFSLEIPLGKRFLTQSRLLTDAEAAYLNR